ncbi:hypothetical protein GCM10009557_43540 [Virgisporangium ochraceum]|uniref:Uncharacterized protein n=1 Tax=Virgisporangium ochraceum TaxID=65505 RepID=A0A8J4A0G7_9ACTN|nr:hypothetical protein [Virgisporangium ochraceum]GIJ72603.1 hypothetical protein Voc01_075200 [Virgisporangium ochraceum]
MRPISRLVAAVAVVLVLGGCADEPDRPAVCDSYDSVQASADDLRNANVSENGLSQVRTDLEDLRHALVQLVDDARAQYATEVDTIEKAAADLRTAVTAARADPGPMTLSAVGDAAAWLRETVHRLGTAMADTC